MAKNTMGDLYDHIFDVIEQLKDAENPMDLARAKAVCDAAQTVINLAKVEVSLIEATAGPREEAGTAFARSVKRAGPQPLLPARTGGRP